MTRLYLRMRLAERVASMSFDAQEQLTSAELDVWLAFAEVRGMEEARDLALLIRP